MSNIDQDFEFNYAAEESKREFQANVESLLELHSLISCRMSSATERGKDGVFFTTGELEVYKEWVMNTASALLEHYGHIDRVNRLAMKLYNISRISEPKKQEAA
jgi:hypothetical protein